MKKLKPTLLKSVLFSCSNSKHVVFIRRHLRGHNKSTMHPSKNYKLFINLTLAHFVWLTANVHKAGEQQDDPWQWGQPRTAPSVGSTGCRSRALPCKTFLLCTMRCDWCSLSHLAQRRRVAVLSPRAAPGKPQEGPTARTQSWEAPAAAAAKRHRLSHRDRWFLTARVCMGLYETWSLASSIIRIPTGKKPRPWLSKGRNCFPLTPNSADADGFREKWPGGASLGRGAAHTNPDPVVWCLNISCTARENTPAAYSCSAFHFPSWCSCHAALLQREAIPCPETAG